VRPPVSITELPVSRRRRSVEEATYAADLSAMLTVAAVFAVLTT
jgi:hypothetical protein